MTSIKITERIVIHQRPDVVFDYTQDYTKRLAWDTFLKRAELMDGALQAAVGVKAYCVAYNGLGMETEYVSFNRPKVTAIKMTKGPFMFKSFLGSWTFKPIDDTMTEVVFLYSFQFRFPFSLFNYFIKQNLQNNVRHRLTDLKTRLEGNA